MKIGIVLSNTPAYSETFFNSKIKGLLSNGFEVVLFVAENDRNFNLCDVKTAPSIYKGSPIALLLSFIKVYFMLLFSSKRVIRFYKLERKEGTPYVLILKKIYFNTHILTSKNIDWIHFGFATQAIGKENIAKSINSKMAVSFRGFDIGVYPLKYPGCYKLLWKHVDKVHSISKYLLHQSYDLGLSVKVPYEVITPAVAIEKLNLVSNKKQKTETIQIVTIARLHWMKGIDLLIETAALLKENKVDFVWEIIGSGDQKATERYQYHIYEKGLSGQVKLLGKFSHENTLKHLKNTGLYVQTSLNEGFCNAVLESQALGKLCIATNVGGLSENIINTKTGWLVLKNNAKSLASKIEEVLSLSNENKASVRAAARTRVESQFTIEQQQREFVKFYSEI